MQQRVAHRQRRTGARRPDNGLCLLFRAILCLHPTLRGLPFGLCQQRSGFCLGFRQNLLRLFFRIRFDAGNDFISAGHPNRLFPVRLGVP